MALFSVRGTISRLGQSEFNNDFCIYAFIEISMPEGERRLLKKIIVFSDMHAAMDVGMEGQFFFDDVFVQGRRYLAQFWGVKTDGRAVIDGVDLRATLAPIHIIRGLLLTPIMFVGLPELIAGIGQAWSLISGSADRKRFFRQMPPPLPAASRTDLFSPERLGEALRENMKEMIARRRERTNA